MAVKVLARIDGETAATSAFPARRLSRQRFIDVGTGRLGPGGIVRGGDEDKLWVRGRSMHTDVSDGPKVGTSMGSSPTRSLLGRVAEALPDVDGRTRLAPEEECALISLAQQGDTAARQRIIEDQLPDVRRTAQALGPIDLHDDLVSEGLIAVNESISKYQPTKGARLKTFATLRTRNAVRR